MSGKAISVLRPKRLSQSIIRGWKPELNGAWVTWAPIGFGQRLYALYVPNHPYPVGLAWGVPAGKCFHVAGSFVQPWARRCGVRSRLNEGIFASFQTIATGHGSNEGGRQFIRAKKYERHQALDCFYLKRPKKA